MINWVCSTQIFTCPDDSDNAIASFGSSISGVFTPPLVGGIQPHGMVGGPWTSVDLKPLGVTADAKWAMIGGIPIITGAADLSWAFRAPGDISTGILDGRFYQEQALSVPVPNGVGYGSRNISFDLVPLINGCFEMAVQASRYPDNGVPFTVGEADGCGVGWNFKLKAWGK